MFVRWQRRVNKKGEEALYAALCSGNRIGEKTESIYIGSLGNISLGDIENKKKREVFWRGIKARLKELALTPKQQADIERAIAQRVPYPKDRNVKQSTGNDEWYTPPEWVSRAREIMGDIDLDPASNEVAQAWIQAKNYYNIQADGLTKPWGGRMWLNPPYSETAPWVGKAIASYATGDVTEAVLLVRPATDTTWFHSLSERFWRAETRGRIDFINGTGEICPKPAHGNVFFYLGENTNLFSEVFKKAKCTISRPVG